MRSYAPDGRGEGELLLLERPKKLMAGKSRMWTALAITANTVVLRNACRHQLLAER